MYAARIVLWTDDPGRGGVAQYNHVLLLALRSAGHDVHLVQSRANTPLVTAQKAAGVFHHWLDYDTSADFAKTLTDADTPDALFRQLRPDLVVFSDGCPLSNFAARQVACARRVPFLCVVGFVAEYLARQFPACLPLLARHYASAREVVAVSRENLDLLRRAFGLGPHRGRVIHYGRPAAYFAPPNTDTRARLRAELGLNDDHVLVLTSARLAPVKGHRHLLGAIADLVAAGQASNARYVWLGNGELRSSLEADIARLGLADRIHLLGHRWDGPDWLDAADIFLLPSEHEGMPLAIMEAMAKGLPVAASSVSGIPEELADTGRLLPNPRTSPAEARRALAHTLNEWAHDTDLRARLGAAARARACTLFREERMLADTLALISTHLPARSHPATASTSRPPSLAPLGASTP